MATVIDALVMTLGLDTSDFDKKEKASKEGLDKFKKSADSVAKDVSQGAAKMAEGFSAVKTQLLGMLALLGASVGLKEFIATNVQGQAELGRMSRNLDMSAQSLEAWGLVAKEMGGRAEDAYGALQNFAGGLAEASIKGHSALTDAAAANGVNLVGIKDTEEGLIRISARMAQLPRQQALYLANQLGVGAMFNQLELGPEELKKRLDAARQLSRATAESTAAAERLQRKWADIQQRFKASSEVAFAKLSPVLERLAERFTTWLDSIDWDRVASGIERIVKRVNEVVQEFGGWKTVLLVVGGLLATKLLSPLLGIVGALTRMVPLLGSGAGALSGFGTALAGIDLAALGGVLAAVGIVYSPALGGKKLKNGYYEDETAPAGAAQGTDDASLWAKVQGRKSAYLGARQQAAMILASRFYAGGDADADALNKQAADILAGKVKPSDMPGYRAPSSEDALFSRLEKQYNLPAGILSNMYSTESGRGKNLLSPKGAKGPFQFMDATAGQLGLKGDDVYDLNKSADAAARYISQLRGTFGGDITKAVAAYNAGPGNVSKYGGTPPFAETQDYVRKVLKGVQIGAATTASIRSPAPAGTSTSTAEVHIGKIDVNTQATDAQGIARDLGAAIHDQGIVALADTGLN